VCRRVREWSQVPIIMLSVREDERTKVQALDAGADDYLTKPFGMEELRARIQAVARRAVIEPGAAPQSVIRAGAVVIDLANRRVSVEGQEVHFTPQEYDILRLLATHPGKIMTHRAILSAVWGPEYAEMTHYVRIYVNQIRKKLRENPAANVRYIHNEPGIGYRFVDLA
jgi:two-component system KDP operon response regulator KdpE